MHYLQTNISPICLESDSGANHFVCLQPWLWFIVGRTIILNTVIMQNHLYVLTQQRTVSTNQTLFFLSIMSRNRFLYITHCLHFTDNREVVRDKTSPDYNKLFSTKVKELFHLLLPRITVLQSKQQLSRVQTFF